MPVFDTKVLAHIGPLLKLASPIILNALFQQAGGMSTIVYVGNYLGPKYMGATILGSMLCNISGYSIGFGMLSALDTLISQAYGAKEYRQMGLFSQRAMAILTLCCIPIIFLWRNGTAFILHHALFIDSDTAALSGLWAQYISFGVWPSFMFEVMKKFLQGQNIIWPIMIASGVGLTCNVSLNHLFLAKLKYGFSGPALTICITNWVTFSTLVSIILIRKALIRCGMCQSLGLGVRAAHRSGGSGAGTKYRELSSSDEDVVMSDDDLDRLESHAGEEGGVEMVASMLNKDDIELTSLIMEHIKDQKNSSSSSSSRDGSVSRQDTGSLSEKSGTTTVESDTEEEEDVHFISDSDFLYDGSQKPAASKLTKSTSPSMQPAHESSNDPEDNWPPLSVEIFHDWLPFLALGVPGAVSLFIEWGSFELAAGLAGQLGSTALAVHSIYMQSCAMLYMPPLALAAAASILVGNFLGEGNCQDAKNVVNLGIMLDFSWGFGVGFLLYTFRHWWVMLFTKDAAVIALSDHTMPIMFIYIIVDAMKCITLNLLRSTGQPEITVFFNFASCLCVLLPVGYFLGIHLKLGLWGIWGGMSCAWSLCAIIYFYCLMKTDWEKQRIVKKVSTATH